jgi:hypothetical protein
MMFVKLIVTGLSGLSFPRARCARSVGPLAVDEARPGPRPGRAPGKHTL